MNGLMLFAHGSRDPAWAQPFESMRQLIQRSAPQVPCGLAYLELMQPDFSSMAAQLHAQGVSQLRVLPVFLSAGKHLRVDLPELVTQALRCHTGLQIEVLPAVGYSAVLQNAVLELALQPYSPAALARSGDALGISTAPIKEPAPEYGNH